MLQEQIPPWTEGWRNVSRAREGAEFLGSAADHGTASLERAVAAEPFFAGGSGMSHSYTGTVHAAVVSMHIYGYSNSLHGVILG